jgi:hypothetical protein
VSRNVIASKLLRDVQNVITSKSALSLNDRIIDARISPLWPR